MTVGVTTTGSGTSSTATSGPIFWSGGGVGPRRLLKRGFEFRVRIEPAHVFTLFFFFMDALRSGRFSTTLFSRNPVDDSATCSVDEDADSASSDTVSLELTLPGRALAPMNGSKPKNVHLLGVFVGLGSPGLKAPGPGCAVSTGIEFLLRGDELVTSYWVMLCVRSSTAPAVLGRESCVAREELRARGDVGSLSAIVEFDSEISEVMLPETE